MNSARVSDLTTELHEVQHRVARGLIEPVNNYLPIILLRIRLNDGPWMPKYEEI